MNGQATAHSVVEASAGSKLVSGAIVIVYALLTITPLVWIILTSFKTPSDAIAYPPKIMFTRGLSVLHAASCAVNGALIAFAGQSGAGKTTTVRAFVQQGAQPVTED